MDDDFDDDGLEPEDPGPDDELRQQIRQLTALMHEFYREKAVWISERAELSKKAQAFDALSGRRVARGEA
jgi:hypothetical protein